MLDNSSIKRQGDPIPIYDLPSSDLRQDDIELQNKNAYRPIYV